MVVGANRFVKFVDCLQASCIVYPHGTCLTDQRNYMYRGFCLDRYFLQETTDLIIMLNLPRPVLAKSCILYQTEKKSLSCDSSLTAIDLFSYCEHTDRLK